MTIELFSSPWAISRAKSRTDRFFQEKSLSYYKRNNVVAFKDVPLVFSFSRTVLTILIEPTDSLLRLVIIYIKEVLSTKKTIGIRISQKELEPLFDGLNCVLI